MDILTKSTAGEHSGKTDLEKLKSAFDLQHHSESSHAIGAGGVFHPETGQEKSFRMSPSNSPRDRLLANVLSSSESSDVKKDSHILEVFEVLNRLGDDLGSLKVPLNYVYDRTLRLHSAGHNAMLLFSDKDNLTLMFLINSRLKQVLKSPQISVIQKVIVEEALVRLNTFLESVVPVVDIKDIAFKCIGESDKVIRDSIQREIMRSFDFAATPKQIQEILLHVKEEQLEIMLRIKQSAALSLSESSTVASPGVVSVERGSPFPKEMATSRLSGSDRYAPQPEDIPTSPRYPSRDASLGKLRCDTMFSVAVLGHSLVPKPIVVEELPDIIVDIYRYPDATIDVLTRNLSRDQFWTKTYNLIIVCIGGNDLTRSKPSKVFDDLCKFMRRVVPLAKHLKVCTIEHRSY